MRLIFITLLALILATVVGLGATWLTATRGTDLGTLRIGAWTARPKTGTAKVADIKPGPPPVLTKRGADVLVRVEKLLDDAGKTLEIGRAHV